MCYIRQFKSNRSTLIWHKCFRFAETIPVPASHYLASYQHLVSVHGISPTQPPGRGGVIIVGEIFRENIYEFYHKIGICGTDLCKNVSYYRSGKGEVFINLHFKA